MKKIKILLIISLLTTVVFSCKRKGYNCECDKVKGGTHVYTNVSTNKSEAQEWCSNTWVSVKEYNYCKLIK